MVGGNFLNSFNIRVSKVLIFISFRVLHKEGAIGSKLVSYDSHDLCKHRKNQPALLCTTVGLFVHWVSYYETPGVCVIKAVHLCFNRKPKHPRTRFLNLNKSHICRGIKSGLKAPPLLWDHIKWNLNLSAGGWWYANI